MVIVYSVLGTMLVVIVVLNFRRPEKEPKHKVERFYNTPYPLAHDAHDASPGTVLA